MAVVRVSIAADGGGVVGRGMDADGADVVVEGDAVMAVVEVGGGGGAEEEELMVAGKSDTRLLELRFRHRL